MRFKRVSPRFGASAVARCDHGSRTQIDIATAVQAQQHDIDGIEYMAIESAEHASGGLRHLVEVQRQAAKLARRRRRAALIAAAGLLVFVGLHWVVTSMHSSNHGSPTWHVLEEELLLD